MLVVIYKANAPSNIMSTPDHLLSDSALDLAPLISRWYFNKFKNCWYRSVRILKVLKLLFHQFLNLSTSQRDMSGPILGDLSNNRWSGGIALALVLAAFWCMRLPFFRHVSRAVFYRRVSVYWSVSPGISDDEPLWSRIKCSALSRHQHQVIATSSAVPSSQYTCLY